MSEDPSNNQRKQPNNSRRENTADEPVRNDETPQQPAAKPSREKRGVNPVAVFTFLVLIVCAALFTWHMVADRFTPFTAKARVQTFSIPIAPQISAYVVKIPVVPNERVEKGQILVELDREPFELAVKSARAALAKAGQDVGALTASVDSAAAHLEVAQARLERSRRNYDRVQRISKKNPGALSEADRDRAFSSLEQDKAAVISARAKLERAKQQLGEKGPENPMIASAVAALDLALFNLSQTTITAPENGWVGNLLFDVGSFAAAGQPLLMLISARDTWIQADLRENNLMHLASGNPVEFVLDVAPGRIFNGTVRSIGVGVSSGQGTSPGSLYPLSSGLNAGCANPSASRS